MGELELATKCSSIQAHVSSACTMKLSPKTSQYSELGEAHACDSVCVYTCILFFSEGKEKTKKTSEH